MPWMLQPKSYTQIARPNLYNVAYRRVGTYKGMGRLHPTNYLQIGVRPNRIGATTGQYNTLSGQLSLLPPSLRGLGQVDLNTLWNLPVNDPWSTMTGQLALQPGAASVIPYVSGAVPIPSNIGAKPATTTNYIPWILGGAVFALLLSGGRR